MPPRHPAVRPLLYAWAFVPNTALGLTLGGLNCLIGGKAERHRGCLEFHGAFITWYFKKTGFAAMTLGHTIVGVDPYWLAVCREHEQVHVRQYENWGPFFLPAYLLSSLWQGLRGRRIYLDNWFERDARRRCGEPL